MFPTLSDRRGWQGCDHREGEVVPRGPEEVRRGLEEQRLQPVRLGHDESTPLSAGRPGQGVSGDIIIFSLLLFLGTWHIFRIFKV